MPWKDLGEVVGKNGTIGNVDSTYVNNGGEPGVSVTKSGDDSAPDLTFEFENLVNDPLTSSEIEQISNDTQLTSSSVLNGTGLTTLWSRIKAKFAPKSHTHDASDITAGELAAILIANGLIDTDMLAAGAVTTAKIADGAVTNAKLDQTLRDSMSRAAYYSETPAAIVDLNEHLEGVAVYNNQTANAPITNSYGLCVCFGNVPGSMTAQGRWVTQLALPTSGYPMWRRKTNQGDWTQWLYMAQ